MPKYEAVELRFPIKATATDLVVVQWRRTNGIDADFVLPGSGARMLRVSFDRDCIVRVLDEMALSTEDDDTANEGLVSEHFAYRLEGARFAHMQSDAWMAVHGPVTHYRFVTGGKCMDVLSGSAPTFSIIVR